MKLFAIAVIVTLVVLVKSQDDTDASECPEGVQEALKAAFDDCPRGPPKQGPHGPKPDDRRRKRESGEHHKKGGPRCIEEKIKDSPILSAFFEECNDAEGPRNVMKCHHEKLRKFNCIDDELKEKMRPPHGPPRDHPPRDD